MIYGTGIDIVDVSRMEEITKKWGDRFVSRVFCQGEIDYCSNCASPALHYAARFAAKESFLKSLGIGLGKGIRLQDIEVSVDIQGKPEVRLRGLAAKILRQKGIGAVHLSLTHTRQTAVAVVVLEKS